ncbi:hypothetical protein HYPSUDRAFT_905207 [Hypholoma sublateritium FD-334 SS-4]|uniref:Uncharacterized protein n=1 Tax=Hypholoma sublateritium (strain FD-334 SS-4) TaxID=945553 RepID=A0A0D2KWZ8_HYPSF|nr:hypothetical protein HYPSUDRAFT_905207 [Hypholoma sublateritium FD-334 SS-4]
MSLSSLPLPSIAHVLISNKICVQTWPTVGDSDIDAFPAMPETYKMTTNDQRDFESLEHQYLSYIIRSQPINGVQASMGGNPAQSSKSSHTVEYHSQDSPQSFTSLFFPQASAILITTSLLFSNFRMTPS